MANNNARYLRKNQTDAERIVWEELRNRRLEGYRFRRQHPIGPYIADFVCLKHKLIIELDGDQHDYPENRLHDEKRAQYLEAEGYKVLRFWNNEIYDNLDDSIQHIYRVLKSLDED